MGFLGGFDVFAGKHWVGVFVVFAAIQEQL
jgi:hypothetical protein